MRKNAATSRQASGRLNGSRSGRASTRSCGNSLRVSQSQTAASTVETAPNTSSGVLHPPAARESGTATVAARAEPIVIPEV